MAVLAESEIEPYLEVVPQVALLVLQRPLAPELLERLVATEAGTEWWVKEAVGAPGASAHILASPPMLLLQEGEVASILEILQSTDSVQALAPIRLTLEPRISCLAVPVELEQLR